MEFIQSNINLLGFLVVIVLLVALLANKRSSKSSSVITSNQTETPQDLATAKETTARATALAEERKMKSSVLMVIFQTTCKD